MLTEAGAGYSRRLFPNTIVIANSGAKTLGVSKILSIACCANDGIAALLDHGDGDKKYICYYLNSRIGHIRRVVAAGNDQLNLNTSRIRDIAVPYPTQKEQERIAEVLSDTDDLIESLEQLVAKKRCIKQGAMQDLLTGQKRLPGFADKWETKQIGEVATVKSEKNTRRESLPVLTCSKHYGFMDSLRFFKNQVFSDDTSGYKIIRHGEIGYPANHIEEGSIGIQDLYDAALVSPIYVVFAPHANVSNFYLHRLLKLDQYRQQFQNATASSVDRRGSLRWPSFSKIAVRLPPLLEQSAIVSILSEMDAEIAAIETKLAKARQIKQGMIQELLTGRIRLIQPAKAEAVPKGHNWAFNEAVVISLLAKTFGSEQYPLGRKRYTKLSYLMHRHHEHRVEGYLKKAAGPYNPGTRYKGPEKIAREKQYARDHVSGTYVGFVAGDNIAEAEAYFRKWYGDDALKWLEQFRLKKNDELELLATVDMAVEDLRREGKAVDLVAVKGVIRDHPEWEAKLDRDTFSELNIARAVKQCGELFGTGG